MNRNNRSNSPYNGRKKKIFPDKGERILTDDLLQPLNVSNISEANREAKHSHMHSQSTSQFHLGYEKEEYDNPKTVIEKLRRENEQLKQENKKQKREIDKLLI